MSQQLFSDFPAVTRQEWEAAARATFADTAQDRLHKLNADGLEFSALPSAEALAGGAHSGGLPGQFPFLRGGSASGYRAQPWQITQALELARPPEFNAALSEALASGATAIHLDDRLTLASRADLETALAGIDLRRVPLFVRRLADAPRIFAWLAEMLAADALSALTGYIGGDPLGLLARDGALTAAAFDQLAAHCQRLGAASPRLGSVAISTKLYHDGGATAPWELALALANGAETLRALARRGIEPAWLAPRLTVTLSIGGDFFTELAKFRAIKALWAQLLQAFGISRDRCLIRLYAESGWRNKTRRDPHMNLLRATTEALAAALGGIAGMSIAPFDQPLGQSSAFSRRLARNLQLILAEEAQLTQLIDPAGGAWHIEMLTDQLARAAWTQFQELEAGGGLAAMLRAGTVQAALKRLNKKRGTDLAAGRKILVGSSRFLNADEPPPPQPPIKRPPVSKLLPGQAIPAQPQNLEQLLALAIAEDGA